MITEIDLFQDNDIPLLDVRSPGEYATGHIPGAISLPLFSDEERKEVGTTYKQVGPKDAFQQGLDFVGPKMSHFVKMGEELSHEGHIKLYCWRGGKRSQSIGWLLQQAGLKVMVLQGGYRSYRQTAMQKFAQPVNLVVLGGHTGCGKTEILKRLTQKGEQVIDLEGLANHRGSAFGGIGQAKQPSNEQFFNMVWEQWRRMDHTRTVWIENESLCIGRVVVPEALLEQMKLAPLFIINAPIKLRMQYLIELYGSQPKKEIAAAINKLSKKFGLQDTKQMLTQLEQGELKPVVNRLLKYYDKGYQHGLNRTDKTRMQNIELPQYPNSWDEWIDNIAILLQKHPARSTVKK
ncbi:MAG: tRNA 2-selenouridine(34) synthase MnmH [Magnetococcales bacterium]|nr:tRNA 2-selenouridine(34) synthase MnmH [Magnetococcales bacterium]